MKNSDFNQQGNQNYSCIRWIITILFCIISILCSLLVFTYRNDNFNFNHFSATSSTILQTTTTSPTTISTSTQNTLQPVPNLTSEIALVVDTQTDTILFEKNSEQITAPASLTKIVTALVALEKHHAATNTTYVTIPTTTLKPFENTMASVVPLKANETVTIKELLYATLLPSACDAANVIAYYYGHRNIQQFVDEMNEYVENLGCKNTHFINPHGLDENGHQTTAKDMYLICKAAIANPEFMNIVQHTEYTIGMDTLQTPHKISTSTALIQPNNPYYFPYTKTIKTGSTDNAGRCLTALAEKDGKSFIVITMKAPFYIVGNDNEKKLSAQIDNLHLQQWAFSCANIDY